MYQLSLLVSAVVLGTGLYLSFNEWRSYQDLKASVGLHDIRLSSMQEEVDRLNALPVGSLNHMVNTWAQLETYVEQGNKMMGVKGSIKIKENKSPMKVPRQTSMDRIPKLNVAIRADGFVSQDMVLLYLRQVDFLGQRLPFVVRDISFKASAIEITGGLYGS